MTKYSNFIEFAQAHKDIPFRFWVYRRIFTPYEQEKKFTDESYYEDTCCKIAYIKELIILPDDDILIGFVSIDYNETDIKCCEYLKLSEIRLVRYDGDLIDE
jgi:hypothetical protein